MRILLTADFHLKHVHKYTSMVEGKVWDVLFEEKIKLLRKIPKIMDKYDCEHLVIAGDVFDTINPPESIKAEFCSILNKCNTPITIIPGNHETTSYGDHAMMDLKQAFLEQNDKKIFIDEPGNEPYRSPLWKLVKIDHLMLEGIDVHYRGAVPLDDERFQKYPTILLGDYHSFYVKKFADKVFMYPGSPYPTRFGESSDSMVVMDIDSNKGKVKSYKRIKLKAYSMKEVNVDISDAEEVTDSIDSALNKLDLNNKVVLKFNIKCQPIQVNNASLKLRECKQDLMAWNPKVLDFVYNIKTYKDDSTKGETSNRTIEEVSMEYIDNNCEYKKPCKTLFKKLMSGVK